MRILVTGASGVMGRAALAELLAAGHDVRGLVRSEAAAESIAALGAHPVRGDLFDRQAMVAAMAGCDAVANLATKVPTGSAALRPWAWLANDRIRARGAGIVAEAARAAGVGRLLQQALTFVYADAGEQIVTEKAPLRPGPALRSALVAEGAVAGFTAAGGEGVCLRYALITGPDAQSQWLLSRVRAGRPAMLGNPDSWTAFIHPADVGTSVAAALRAPAGVYNVAAEPARRRDVAAAYARAAGVDEARFLPRPARVASRPLTYFLCRSHRVSSAAFSAATGWEPRHRSIHPGWFDA